MRWTGAVAANGIFTTGNAETVNIGVNANAVRRSEQDRITLGAGYLYGRQRNPSIDRDETTVDNVFGTAKYDCFLSKRIYVFGTVRAERDKIADLDLRFIPAVGVVTSGSRPPPSPVDGSRSGLGLRGLAGSDDHFAARLAYHVDTGRTTSSCSSTMSSGCRASRSRSTTTT